METTLINQLQQAFAKAGLETMCSYDAHTMTSKLLVKKENKRLKQIAVIHLHFSDLEGRQLCDINAYIEQCELKPIQP